MFGDIIHITDEEIAAAPENLVAIPMRGKLKDTYRYALAISPLDCMGCGVCIGVCPTDSLSMVGAGGELAEQDVFDYCVEKVADKPEVQDNSVKGSQFKQPLLEFSGACAGCAETSYARLVTQLFGDRMFISNATGCSSIWGGPAATSPYTVNKEGRGPAWANSLFEDNAEHGYGMLQGHTAVRQMVIEQTKQLLTAGAPEGAAAAAQAWLDARDDSAASKDASAAYVVELEKLAEGEGEAAVLAAKILANKDYLAKKSIWIFGGDGWAYDIGFGGLDHVLASGKDVNILVFDTEVYSNTGGQASKATPTGSVAQFAAAGKETKKKSLAEIAMTYGYVYTAQVCMGADYNQCIKALSEAESYHGPSLVIAYAPCINHGIRKGMGSSMLEAKAAVAAGYWNMFRFDPRNAEAGKNPFTLDSKEPTESYKDFILGEVRYSSLQRSFPERAEVLFENAAETAKQRYEHLKRLSDLYSVE